jgi:hypothetical protein
MCRLMQGIQCEQPMCCVGNTLWDGIRCVHVQQTVERVHREVVQPHSLRQDVSLAGGIGDPHAVEKFAPVEIRRFLQRRRTGFGHKLFEAVHVHCHRLRIETDHCPFGVQRIRRGRPQCEP